ncbi:phosphatidylinositol-specific phospholipase C/glycerophosphodiester phosphodiesterase family protein [Paenibacillus rhizophilus]|nr:phosphatidylinositol-specific phospholipase C/glycerophosphodiester phosphodiesterase family protein [Paenibacillus rhizophilus]
MKKKTVLSFAVLFSLALLLLLALSYKDEEESGTGLAAYRIVAHGMGSVNGHKYTNAFEAFVANYEAGTRMFETDLLLTSDGKLVARHEWTKNMSKELGQLDALPAHEQGKALSYEDFMNTPILDIYSPMDWDTVLDLLQHYPDAYIVTDIKKSGKAMAKEFEMLVEKTLERDPALLTRIVPQIYNRPMLEELNKIYAFPHVIYTLYDSPDSDEEVIEFIQKTNVDITMPVDRANAGFVGRLKDAGARVYVHTVNDMREIRRLHRLGVDGFYTDFVSENEVKTSGGLRRSLWPK